MNSACDKLLDQCGMILIAVLLLLSLLMAAGMGAAISVQNDFRMTANLRAGTAAAYLADAGVESAKERIAAATTMPPALSNATQSLPQGSYSVSFLSSTQILPLRARVVLRSMGSTHNASQVVHAGVVKTYDLADGAIALRGNTRNINFTGASFSISGLDHDLITAEPVSDSRPRAGITVESTAVLKQLQSALDNAQRGNITGDDGSGAVMAASRRIPPNDIARLANDLCAAANAIVLTVPTAGSLSVASELWGSREVPQLRCVNGLPGSGDSVVFGANIGGAGILVIRDAELILTGDFRWEGWVIISGGDVGFRVLGGDNKEILGALIIHESGNGTGSGPATLDLQGSLGVRFSRQAFNLAAPLVPPATLSASYSALPFTLKQVYWRSISP